MFKVYRVLRDTFAIIGLISFIILCLYFGRAPLLQCWLNSLKAQDSFTLKTRQVYISPSFDRLVLGLTTIKNPPNYGVSDALVFSNIDIALDSPIRWQGRWNVKRAQITIQRLNIIKKPHGDNLDELGILIKTFDAPKHLRQPFKAEEVIIVLREIAFIDPSMPHATTTATVNLQVTDHHVDSYSKIYDSLMKLIAEIGRSG
jgi:hypothetical protein